MIKEKNYDFIKRHWQVHIPGRRDPDRNAAGNELMFDDQWKLGCAAESPGMVQKAVSDLQDYLFVSMNLSFARTGTPGEKVLWFQHNPELKVNFVLNVRPDQVTLEYAKPEFAFRAAVYIEDLMNLAESPVLELGVQERTFIYRYRNIHSGSGVDYFPDSEFVSMIHCGYDSISIFVEDFDRNHVGYLNINDIIKRAKEYGLHVCIFNYLETWIHPDDSNAGEVFDKTYGELFRRYPDADAIGMCGESLQFPSKDPNTNGKKFHECVVDGIPDNRPCPGWYPCSDYPAYLKGISDAIHAVKPEAEVIFSTYNWSYAPLEIRRKFLESMPKEISLSVCYEIQQIRKLEGLHVPVMDYTISMTEPGYYFDSEVRAASELGLRLQSNCNTAGIAWDFGCVPYVPTPQRWLKRSRHLRKYCLDFGVDSHYATHHYGYWQAIPADIGKWTSWLEFEPDYDELFKKIAIRDYGKEAAPHVMKAWEKWSEAMDHYVATNEDQYGPWRVGAAYPFIFHGDITRTMVSKEIDFPTNENAHFGGAIIKTFYHPYETAQQSPGFLRFPAELRALERMLKLWDEGLLEAQLAVEKSRNAPEFKQENALRLEALGHFIRNSIRTTGNIKKWWQINMAMFNSPDAETALQQINKLRELLETERVNVIDTMPAVAVDSRIGWEPSMEYVCDQWHLDWKLRQLDCAAKEIDEYEKMINLHLND